MTGQPPEFDPPIGTPEALAPGLRRIVAPNPSPMTFRGTNTYLLGETALALIDPGPDSDAHLEAILAALAPGQRISHIFVTHAHVDHSPLAARLSREVDAPVHAFGPASAGQSPHMAELAAQGHAGGGEGIDAGFAPHEVLSDGAVIAGKDWQIEAIWTPGHLSNHMCFASAERLFCGDHVMGWASSLVSPPDGDLTAFMASCEKLRHRPETVYHSGHGAPITAPQDRLDWLIHHRKSREADIIEALLRAPATPETLTAAIYTDVPRHLWPIAERNVFAHLIDLVARDLAAPDGPLSPAATYTLTGA